MSLSLPQNIRTCETFVLFEVNIWFILILRVILFQVEIVEGTEEMLVAPSSLSVTTTTPTTFGNSSPAPTTPGKSYFLIPISVLANVCVPMRHLAT